MCYLNLTDKFARQVNDRSPSKIFPSFKFLKFIGKQGVLVRLTGTAS